MTGYNIEKFKSLAGKQSFTLDEKEDLIKIAKKEINEWISFIYDLIFNKNI